MCDQDRFEYEKTQELWWEEQDKDAKWIAEQEGISERLDDE